MADDSAVVDYKYMKKPRDKRVGLWGWLKGAYYKYQLSTALYMLDPWERTIFSQYARN